MARVLACGLWSAVRLGLGGAGRPAGGVHPPLAHPAPARPTVGVVVLSHNRWPALEQTLDALASDPSLAAAPVFVADNASTDGTVERIRQRFPGVRLVALSENRGVAGFNRAAELAGTDTILILDDDARPEPGVVGAALDLLARNPDVGAVALHPRHPQTKASEWPFGEGASPRQDWPVMGCGNLIRRHVWERVGGYEESFFLYRNDTDLAMKLHAAGFGVHFDPAWIVWHDSPVAAGGAKKSVRWFELATRNWVWLCRRHGRGVSGLGAILTGWLWAHRLAGLDMRRHWSAINGFFEGWLKNVPPLPHGTLVDGDAVRRLLRIRSGR